MNNALQMLFADGVQQHWYLQCFVLTWLHRQQRWWYICLELQAKFWPANVRTFFRFSNVLVNCMSLWGMYIFHGTSVVFDICILNTCEIVIWAAPKWTSKVGPFGGGDHMHTYVYYIYTHIWMYVIYVMLVWYRMVRYGTVWYGMIRYGYVLYIVMCVYTSSSCSGLFKEFRRFLHILFFSLPSA